MEIAATARRRGAIVILKEGLLIRLVHRFSKLDVSANSDDNINGGSLIVHDFLSDYLLDFSIVECKSLTCGIIVG